ncbi:MAG: hypothetical protein NZT92_12750 [Abditibacteriales bacterium]|nr:hypothetical protein [Abditibacteriales bacterium]MDW8364846.1 hypothetical protein [Abditibacteriales bacterium]
MLERLGALEREVGKLKEQNLRLRRGLMGVLVVALVPYLLAVQKQIAHFSIVHAERFDIVKGKEEPPLHLALTLLAAG